jgi:hypothetical protein
MTDDNMPRWVHTCSRCGVTEPTDRCEEECPVCQVAMAADKLQPPPDADELARKQRVVDAIGVYMSKPAKPIIPRRWRRPGFR